MSLTHLLILAVILMLFFPTRISGLGKGVGDAIRGFKKGLNEDDTIDVTETSKRSEQIRQAGNDDDHPRSTTSEKDSRRS